MKIAGGRWVAQPTLTVVFCSFYRAERFAGETRIGDRPALASCVQGLEASLATRRRLAVPASAGRAKRKQPPCPSSPEREGNPLLDHENFTSRSRCRASGALSGNLPLR